MTSQGTVSASHHHPAVPAKIWRRVNKTHMAAVCFVLLLVLPPGWLSAETWRWGMRWVYLLAISFLMANLLTPVCMALAFRWNVLDIPTSRKLHATPIPRMGGLAIFAAVMLATARNFQFSQELTGLALAGGLVFAVGFMDDARGLSAAVRLAAQVAATFILVAFDVRVTFIPHIPGELILEILVTLVWMVGITNAFNFLDGVDGLASGMGALCASLFLAIAWPSQSQVSYFTVVLAGGCLGFLPYNWRPARIFLGDGGSTFVGFTLAGLAVMGTWAEENPLVALSTPILIMAIPIFDMIYTTVSRVRNGLVHNMREWLEYTGKDHFHHRLMHLGMSEKQTVGFILMVNLSLGLASITIRHAATPLGAALLLFQAFLIFLMIVSLMLLGRQPE